MDDDIEYDEDFEEADDEEEYIPQIKSSSPSPPSQSPDGTPNKVTFRPMSSQSLRAPTPPLGKESPVSASAIKKATQSENERMARKSPMPTSPDMGRKRGGGLMAEYESTMPKFNLAGSASPAQRAALARLRDLRDLQIPSKLGIEVGNLFQQKPQQDIQLFLAGKSLKYCKLKTTSCQTGDDDVEVGVNTDEVWTDDKEMQFPTLTSGQTAKSTGAEAQLLPFLRRVLPLFEASIVEGNRRAGVVAPPPADEQLGQTLVRCSLPESFVSTFIGAWPSVVDVSIVEKWYGADHALALYGWEEVVRPPPSEILGLANFMRPIRSLVGLHPIVLGGSGGASTRPARCLYAFCRLSSLTVVNGRSHLIVAGSETGSLLVYDLRARARSPADLQGESEGPPPNPDADIAHFEGPVWLPSAFSTDVFALGPTQRESDFGEQNGILSEPFGFDGDSSGVHEAEICCVRSSDMAAGDALVFALDITGTVSFWRVLELASVGVKLALQGSLALARGPHSHVLADFLGASYLCIHPQQQGEFVALSTAGIRQANRQRSLTSNVADGPRNLELLRHAEEEEGLLLPSDSFASQPCSGAFNPFFPGLLLVAFAEGDLALFDCSLCVPVTHWASAVGKATGATISVAWSTRRPCVFFVKCGDMLDVWDLAERTHVPVHSTTLEDVGPPRPPSAVSSCCELFVSADGRPVVSMGSSVLLLGLPGKLTAPLQQLPRQHVADRPIEEMLLPGYEKDQVFPTLARHARSVDVPPLCTLERDVLRHIVAGINPMQAWV